MVFVQKEKQKNKINYPQKAKTSRAFMLIEALTLLFVFSLIMVTFYSVFTVGLRYIQDAKNRLGALAVANERLEIVRNLAYDNIGTVGGTIEGEIPQDLDISENTRQYHVHTEAIYVDDPFDGIAFADTVWFEDYKKVTIIVSWNNGGNTENVELVSRFVPPGIEVPQLGDGILSVNIFSDQPGGSGIPDSKVQIYNPDTGINTYAMTDSSGTVTFMGSNVENSIQKYQIAVTKNDYETVVTMPPYPDSPYEPVDVHASVVTGSMNVKNIVQNELANIKILTVNYLNEPIADIDFHIVGGRKLGTDTSSIPFVSIYNLDEDNSVDSGGEKTFSSISPGEYELFLVDPALSDYEIISINPASPFYLLSSAGTLDVTVKLASKTATSLLVTVLDNIDDAPIVGSTVKLTNTSLGYDVELVTGSDGKVFFPASVDPFLPGTYHMKITTDGFPENNSDITVNLNELKLETLRL
jgi:hypothetical protein